MGPSLPPSLKPRQRLTPTSSTEATEAMEATVLATTATVWATATELSTVRGRLRLSPTTATTDLVTGPTATPLTATATDLSMARGRLRPRLTLTTMVDTATAMDSATAMVATVLATGPTGDKLLQSLQDLNHRRKTLTLFV